jgi:hypothetical protein
MKDVSGIFDHYRLSARTIWNIAFWPDADFRNWDSIDQFDKIQKILFSKLVLGKVAMEWPLQHIFENAIPFFHVVPSIKTAPIMIQNPRPDKPRGYWDHPINRVSPGEAELHFLGYFDWNRMDYADLRYYHVVIARFDAHPDLVGREALIERQPASVFKINE